MRSTQVDDWAMFNQVKLKYKAPHQKAWLFGGHNALIRTTLQRAKTHVIKEPLCASFVTAS